MRLVQCFVNDPTDRFPFSHGSFVVAPNAAQLACAWFSGSLEGHADAVIRLSRLGGAAAGSPLVGPQWSDPETIAEIEGRAVGNPVLFTETDLRWHLIFVGFPPKHSRETELLIQTSEDGGLTWGPSRVLGTAPGYWPRHALVILDGAWLLPVCNIYTRPPRSYIWRSTDNGKSWSETVLPGSERLIQPALVHCGGDELQVYFRDMQCRRLHRSVSIDGGHTWSAPEPTELPNNNSGIHVLPLASGRLLVAFTDRTERARRSPITVALSEDGGRSWPVSRELIPYVDVDAALIQYSYPSMVQTPDGVVHLTLTYEARRIAHYAFDEAWIAAARKELVERRPAQPVPPRYSVRTLKVGETIYLADKTAILLDGPEYLVGRLAICPVNTDASRTSDAEGYISFSLNRPATVCLAYDGSASEYPRWLNEFSPVPDRINTSIGQFSLFEKYFEKGDHCLGGNLQKPASGARNMYFAFLIEA